MTNAPAGDVSWLHVLLAFSFVMALMAGLGFVLKYFSTRGFALRPGEARARRMKIVETMAVDARRRFVIVRCDRSEHLLLLGGQDDIVVQANLPPAPSDPA